MDSPQGVTRAILVVLDGLRADAAHLFPLPHLTALARRGAYTFAGRTVSPSITSAAMTSLFTGVSPHVHGIRSDLWGMPRPAGPLTLLAPLLRRSGLTVRGFMAALPPVYRGLGARMASRAGIDATFRGDNAHEILDTARLTLIGPEPGLTILHWPDADRAGHAQGWTSPAYVGAARVLDDALDRLVRMTGVLDDPGTILIAMADHGGGGAQARNHESAHPLDVTIPIVVAGGQVAWGELAPFRFPARTFPRRLPGHWA